MKKVSKEDALTIVLETAADAEAAKAMLNRSDTLFVPTEPTEAIVYEGGGWWCATSRTTKL